jgi:hypothetical protein
MNDNSIITHTEYMSTKKIGFPAFINTTKEV